MCEKRFYLLFTFILVPSCRTLLDIHTDTTVFVTAERSENHGKEKFCAYNWTHILVKGITKLPNTFFS